MSQKTLRNFQIAGALYSGVGAGAQEAQAGDSVRLFLNQAANPDFPEFIDGIIQPPVTEINVVDSGGHVVPGRSYSFSYESDDLDGAAAYLSACDIINVSVISCCVAVREALDDEIAARTAADTALGVRIDNVEDDLDTWDVLSENSDELPGQGVAGVPQVETQTIIGTVVDSGYIEVEVTAAALMSSVTVNVDVDAGDVPSVSAAKVAAALAANAEIAEVFNASNIGADYALTQKEPTGNDPTLNITHALLGTASGIVPDISSTTTVTGVAEIEGTTAHRVGQHFQTSDERVFEAFDTSPNRWRELTTDKTSVNVQASRTALTGGANALDGISVSSDDSGRTQLTRSGTVGYVHTLIAGTTVENPPFIVRPDNYGASNQFIWQFTPIATNSAMILDASYGGNGAADLDKVVKFGPDGDLTCTFQLSVKDSVSGFVFAFKSASLTQSWDGFAPNASGTLALAQTVVAATPTTGFTITGSRYLDQTHYLTPAGTLATGTFTLPTSANSRAGQIIRLWSTQIVTALTVNVSGGGTILGTALTAAAVNTPYAFQCVSVSGAGTWIRLQ